MSIIGIGTDIIETSRIQNMCENQKGFMERIFTSSELEYSLNKASKYLHLAARFAAKEAVAKALGQSFSWQDVELVRNEKGKPIINLYGKAKSVAKNYKIHISISHAKEYASAVAVIESND